MILASSLRDIPFIGQNVFFFSPPQAISITHNKSQKFDTDEPIYIFTQLYKLQPHTA